MADEPTFGKPDVRVESRVKKLSDPSQWYMSAEYTAICNYGCGSFHTPDVNQVIIWTVEHEASEGHKLAKGERLRPV